MPLHDWTDRPGWEGMQLYWMTEIGPALRTVLPPGYRAILGSSPMVAIGAVPVKPDVVVAAAAPAVRNGHPREIVPEPDVEVAVATLDDDVTVQVERDGRLVTAIELVSPRNKDRPDARPQYGTRYLRYIRGGVHLLLVDVHRRPNGFSFAGMIAEALETNLRAGPAPETVSYRVGPTAAQGGRRLAVWYHALSAGQPLPPMPLPLTPDEAIMVDLEGTYARAAHKNYLD